MRIKTDEKNKVVIAEGKVYGKKVKVVAVCSKEDTFDRDFGTRLAKAKYAVLKNDKKIKTHESKIKSYKAEIARLLSLIETEKSIVSDISSANEKAYRNVISIVAEKYETC